MYNKTILRNLWLGVTSIAVVLALTIWFGYESERLRFIVLALNLAAFLLALPSSLIVIPVAFAANYYLDINALSTGGIYFNSFILLFVGAVQWFLITNQIAPFESRMQRLEI
ncbi:MAG: hypothetical protein IPJ30_06455 [Acidobacteria bacterium]|nr:hypothetical protein [Acidobacteriota bacterium]MBK8149136.1 hypothetical protein [Acidobacteriota bacterium]